MGRERPQLPHSFQRNKISVFFIVIRLHCTDIPFHLCKSKYKEERTAIVMDWKHLLPERNCSPVLGWVGETPLLASSYIILKMLEQNDYCFVTYVQQQIKDTLKNNRL